MTELGPCTPERKVLGELSNVKPEPLSPTANLRLLTTLASSLKNANELPSNCDRNNSSPVPTSSSAGIKLLPRKQKSLGLLCNKFLNMFPLDSHQDPPQEISLDCTAKALGTEKRRIYDIINILESLEMATKAGKNRYLWHGQKDLCQTLGKLKSIGIKKLGLHKQIHEIQKINNLAHRVNNNCTEDNHTPSSSSTSSSPGLSNLSTIFLDETSLDDEAFDDVAFKEDKSLGAMCQKFLMLFLVSLKNGVINLDMAAKVLITDMDNQSDNASKSRFTTKVRRLYDIANVLTAIGLIDKVHTYDRAMRKPVFKYIGPNVYPDCLNSETPIQSLGSTPIGMSTPNKSCNSSNNPLNQEITINTWSGTRCKTFTNDLTSDTPTADKRKPRKRKLFDTDASSSHSTCLEQEKKNQSLDRLDYSIFRVAEMELERLNSSEESKPKACKKLIIRYNSDSCIVQSSNSREKKNHDAESQTGNVPMVVVSKENLVTGERSNNNTIFTYGNNPQTPKLSRTILKKIPTNQIKTQKIIIQQPAVAAAATPQGNVIQLLPINTCQTLGTIYPKINNVKIEKSESTCSNVKLQTQGNIINFANINGKKLIPIKRCDLKWSVPGKSSPSGQGYAILTRIQAPVVSPGDTFKAVKVGNTLQLVPMTVHCNNDNGNKVSNEDK